MRRHAGLARPAHPEAFLRLGQDDGRLALVALGGREGGVQLAQVVAAAAQRVDLALRHVGDEGLQIRMLTEEIFEIVGAVLGAERLVLAVDGRGENPEQRMVPVEREERVPVRAPQHLDDVPAGAGEQTFELLDDLPVAAHRPVEPLQVAVHDEGDVVEVLARGERQGGGRLWLVHLAVAEHAPDVAAVGLGQAPVAQVAQEAGLIDGVDRADAHRTRRELPEIRHQPGMRIGAETVAAEFLAIGGDLVLVEPALEEGAGIDARRRMRLEIDEVARGTRLEEVIEARLEDLGRRGIARDVPRQGRHKRRCRASPWRARSSDGSR